MATATARADDAPSTATTRQAFGITVDLLPTVLSAIAGDVGGGVQLWYGRDHIKARLVAARIHFPEFIAGGDGFTDQRTAAFAFIVDYVFGPHFDGWWVGGGAELWLNSIGHDGTSERADWTNVVATVGGGYIWCFAGNWFLEPWAAGHVLVNDASVTIGVTSYSPGRVTGEISLKVGVFFDFWGGGPAPCAGASASARRLSSHAYCTPRSEWGDQAGTGTARRGAEPSWLPG